jgi:predicted outer membrane protein
MEQKLALKKSQRLETQAIKQFLVNMRDANKLYILQGKLLKERGTTAMVRAFGDSIIADRMQLIHDIEAIAAREKIHLPSNLSQHNNKAVLKQFADKKGREFDKKFMKALITYYKTDAAVIEKMPVSNTSITDFATMQIAVDKTHIEKIEMLRQEQYEKHFSMRAKYRAWNRGYLFSLILGQFLI